MANLYDKASLVLPSSPAYKAGVIQAYKPLTDGGTFDFTRATSANRINSDNLIESVGNNVPRMDYTDGSCPSLLLEPQSTNLITYPVSFGNSYWSKSGASIKPDPSTAGAEQVANGNFATDSAWLKEAGWTISGGTANCVNGQGISIYQTNVVDIGKQYKLTFSISNYSQGYLGSLGNDFGGVVAEGDGSYEIYGTATSASFGFSAFGNFIGSVDNVSVKEVQGFSSPSADEPLGAYKLVESTSTGIHLVKRSNFPSGVERTFSFFAKKGERDYVSIFDGNAPYPIGVIFNLANGTVEYNQDVAYFLNPKIELISNGWYKCSVAWTNSSLSVPSIATATSTTNSYTGDGTSGVYIFGAQLEQQSYPTSFIYNGTEGSSVTRVADACSKTGISDLIGQERGTMFLEAEAQSGFRAFSICDGSTSNRISIVHNVPSSFRVIPVYGGVVGTQLSASYTSGNIKIAVAYGGGNYSMFVNGVKINSTSIGTFSSTLNKIEFAQGNGGNLFAGDVKQSVLFQTALTDSECIALTTL